MGHGGSHRIDRDGVVVATATVLVQFIDPQSFRRPAGGGDHCDVTDGTTVVPTGQGVGVRRVDREESDGDACGDDCVHDSRHDTVRDGRVDDLDRRDGEERPEGTPAVPVTVTGRPPESGPDEASEVLPELSVTVLLFSLCECGDDVCVGNNPGMTGDFYRRSMIAVKYPT